MRESIYGEGYEFIDEEYLEEKARQDKEAEKWCDELISAIDRPLPSVFNEDTLANLGINLDQNVPRIEYDGKLVSSEELGLLLDEYPWTYVPLLEATWPDLMIKQKQVEQDGDREQIDRWVELLRRVEPLMQRDPKLRLSEALRATDN